MNETNRAYWNAMAAVHGEGHDTYYDVDALVAGTRGLAAAEEEALALAVGDVAGKDVLHLQCHLAFDGIVLAQRGARVVGADFSSAALAKAGDIAARAGVELELVEADSTNLPATLHGRFDLVYATIGVLGWISDIDAWFDNVAVALKPGGRLVLVELHPLLNAFGTVDPLLLDFAYGGGEEHAFDEDGSYADPDAKLAATKNVVYPHSLGETVTAALGAGLRVEALREHLDAEFDPRGGILGPAEDDGRYRLRLAGTALPVLFTLVAAKA